MNNFLQDNFTILVKTKLLQKRLSVADLARALGLSRNYVSRAINNRVYPTAREAIRKELKIRGK